MSKDFNVDGQVFTFEDDWAVSQYDEWPTYRTVAGGALSAMGCDLIAIDGSRLYLIEVKDYTYEDVPSPPKDLFRTVARKAFDTMAMLFALRRTGNEEEKQLSALAVNCTEVVICLHVEQRGSALNTKKLAVDQANLQQQIYRLTKKLSATKPRVSSVHLGTEDWTVKRDPATRDQHKDR